MDNGNILRSNDGIYKSAQNKSDAKDLINKSDKGTIGIFSSNDNLDNETDRI